MQKRRPVIVALYVGPIKLDVWMNQIRVYHLRTNHLISQIISRQAPIFRISET